MKKISVKWKCVIIIVCIILVDLSFQLLVKHSVLVGHIFKLASGNNTSFSVHSNKHVMKTIQTIRQRNCQLDSSHYIRQACVEERKSVKYRRLPWSRRLPGCIIIGTFKSGTRELIDFLYMHPRIVIRREPFYELSFFDSQASKGLEWYRNQMPLSVPGQLTIEKSPNYYYSEKTPLRIKAMNSSIKLILMVRDPLDRALSEFHFRRDISYKRYGVSFYKCAIDLWTKKINEKCLFLRNSLYDLPISRYLKHFNRKQIYIIDATDFRRNPLKVLHGVEDFLDIPHMIKTEDFVYNTDRNVFCLRSATNEGVCFNNDRGRNSFIETISPELRQKLKAWFKPHNEKFFSLIKTNFSWT